MYNLKIIMINLCVVYLGILLIVKIFLGECKTSIEEKRSTYTDSFIKDVSKRKVYSIADIYLNKK